MFENGPKNGDKKGYNKREHTKDSHLRLGLCRALGQIDKAKKLKAHWRFGLSTDRAWSKPQRQTVKMDLRFNRVEVSGSLSVNFLYETDVLKNHRTAWQGVTTVKSSFSTSNEQQSQAQWECQFFIDPTFYRPFNKALQHNTWQRFVSCFCPYIAFLRFYVISSRVHRPWSNVTAILLIRYLIRNMLRSIC